MYGFAPPHRGITNEMYPLEPGMDTNILIRKNLGLFYPLFTRTGSRLVNGRFTDVWTTRNFAPCLRDMGIKSASLGTTLIGSTKTWLPRCSGLWVLSVPSRRLLARASRSSNRGGRSSFFALPRYEYPLYVEGSCSHLLSLGLGCTRKVQG